MSRRAVVIAVVVGCSAPPTPPARHPPTPAATATTPLGSLFSVGDGWILRTPHLRIGSPARELTDALGARAQISGNTIAWTEPPLGHHTRPLRLIAIVDHGEIAGLSVRGEADAAEFADIAATFATVNVYPGFTDGATMRWGLPGVELWREPGGTQFAAGFGTLANIAFVGAQPGEVDRANSIEWLTTDSDAVVRGVITGVVRRELPAGSGQSGSDLWYDATVRVDDTLKGPPMHELHVGLLAPLDTSWTPEPWRVHHTDLVLFLVAGARRQDGPADAPVPWELHDGFGYGFGDVLELGVSHAYTASFAVEADPAEVVATIRATAGSTITRSVRLDVPEHTAAFKELSLGRGVWLWVPATPALEQLAIGALNDADPVARANAVEALGSYPSDANIDRIRAHLDDRGSSEYGGRRHYYIRALADQILTGWSVAHTTPVVDELISD